MKSLERRLKITEDRLHQERADRASKLSDVEEKLIIENAKLQVLLSFVFKPHHFPEGNHMHHHCRPRFYIVIGKSSTFCHRHLFSSVSLYHHHFVITMSSPLRYHQFLACSLFITISLPCCYLLVITIVTM